MRTPPPPALRSLRLGGLKPDGINSTLKWVPLPVPSLVSFISMTSGLMYSTKLAKSAAVPAMLFAFNDNTRQFADSAASEWLVLVIQTGMMMAGNTLWLSTGWLLQLDCYGYVD